MNVTKDSVSPTEVTLNIEMTPEDEEPFVTRSYRRLVTRVNIPGFRPGKAPRSIVEQQLGRSALIQEALDFMVPETLDQVLKDENLQAFMEPQLEILEMEPVSFKAVVPLEPVVDLGDMASIELERQPVEVTDEQVDELLERLRFDSAPWEPADRPVQFGDLLTLNVHGTIAGEEAINDEGIDFIPQQDNPSPIPGFSIYLEGMTEGQEKEFTLPIPEDHGQEQYAGKDCSVKVELLSIKEKILPELDDEFAKGVRDGYESMEALTSFLRQQLTDHAEHASNRQAEQDGLDKLLEISTIQASQMIYDRELDSLYEERERSVRNQRLDMDTYLSYIGKSEEEWREQLKPQADQRLRTFLVLRKLAQDEEIEVDTDEVQTEIDTMINQSGESQDAMRQAFSSDNAKDSIRSSLLSRKVMQRLVEIIEGRSGSIETSEEADADEPDAGEPEAVEPDSVESEAASEPSNEPEPEAE
ncbi:MAG: trigger factor [SAR202 cluster bacterium Io17-Chloro-G4]|nr:MAG: trigger factor [SAR202 cluster bacterium Io17-Chloro-G4]